MSAPVPDKHPDREITSAPIDGRREFLPFALPDLDNSELNEISEVLSTGWITTGMKTRAFEMEFARAVDSKHAIAVNSCTAALHLALEAIGIQKGDEVITTPYTFAASAEIIRYFDALPVFVDVDENTFNMNPDLIEKAISRKTKAILPVHIAGQSADLDAIHQVSANHGLPVVEDAAHAFPARYKGKTIGSLSDFTCFSFYATKTITTGEGGMICTDNEELADRCRIMSLHGISKDAWKRYAAGGSWYYEILAPGFKYNMTDIAAAMGLAQLRKAENMAARRATIALRYTDAFAPYADLLEAPFEDPECLHSWHLYMLRLILDHLAIDRDRFVEELKVRNIGASVHFIPLHVHPYYRDTYGYKPEDFPVAHNQYLREVSLPIYSKMSDTDVDDVISAVVAIVEENRR